MEIKETALTRIQRGTIPVMIKVGQYVRVKIIKRLSNKNVIVELRGKKHIARVNGSLTSRLFIARVQKLSPRLELKFIKSLDSNNLAFNARTLESILDGKKSFIRELIVSDNFLKALFVPLRHDWKAIRSALKEGIYRQNIFKILGEKKEIVEFFLLQNLHNLINSDAFYFLLPLHVGQRNCLGEFKLIGGKESPNNGFLLRIYLDNEIKIDFLVFIDYELISCTLSTNNTDIENELKRNTGVLVNGLRALKYNRAISVQFTSYSDEEPGQFRALKKIDLRM